MLGVRAYEKECWQGQQKRAAFLRPVFDFIKDEGGFIGYSA